jgi:hypothetical protein
MKGFRKINSTFIIIVLLIIALAGCRQADKQQIIDEPNSQPKQQEQNIELDKEIDTDIDKESDTDIDEELDNAIDNEKEQLTVVPNKDETPNKNTSMPSKPKDINKDTTEPIIDIEYMGQHGKYLLDGQKGWHDFEYVYNLYEFNNDQINRHIIASPDTEELPSFAAYTYLNDKNNTLYFSTLYDNTQLKSGIYRYELDTQKLERIADNPEFPYLIPGKMLNLVHHDTFEESYITDYRDIEYHNGILYYINTSPELVNLGLYSLKPSAKISIDTSTETNTEPTKPQLISDIETELILKVDNNGVYFVNMNNELYIAKLDGSGATKLFAGQIDNKILIDNGNIIVHSNNGPNGNGLYLIDKSGKTSAILLEKNNNSKYVAFIPKTVVNNYLYYDRIEGTFDKHSVSKHTYNRINLANKTIENILPNDSMDKYTFLGALNKQMYFIDRFNKDVYQFNQQNLILEKNNIIEMESYR